MPVLYSINNCHQFVPMETTILRSQVLKHMDGGEPFDLVFVTCDRKRGTGGELIQVAGWQKITGTPVATGIPGTFKPKTDPPPSKDPNHRKHKTVNIFNPGSNRIHPITVHIRLIQFYNNQRVLNG